ncbi:leucine-rich repeat domain-containing protein, partial [Patescibacteria group bacterium]|nr:leucine-rich repeat domain-containing protein [Patescibacteria group bacterium]
MKHLLILSLCVVTLGSGCLVWQDTPASPTSPLGQTSQPQDLPPQEQPPQEQPKPTSGTTLDLSDRGLTSIPSDVFSRTDLEHLDLSGNRLTGAPQAEIRHLQNLKTLDLSGNQLTGLPAELGQLRKLETLNVSNNQLTGLPNELGNLTQLRVFDISGNPYSTLDLDGIATKLFETDIRR